MEIRPARLTQLQFSIYCKTISDSIQAALPQWARSTIGRFGVMAAGQTVHQAPEVIVAEPVEERSFVVIANFGFNYFNWFIWHFLFGACSRPQPSTWTEQTQVAAQSGCNVASQYRAVMVIW